MNKHRSPQEQEDHYEQINNSYIIPSFYEMSIFYFI